MHLDVTTLEALHARRLCIVDRLERAVAFEHVTQETSFLTLYGPHWPRGSAWARLRCRGRRVPAVQYLRSELENLNAEAKLVQENIHQGQREAAIPTASTETPLGTGSGGELNDGAAAYEPPCEVIERSTSERAQ